MPIIPYTEELLFSILFCPVCKKYYQRTPAGARVTCAVNHPPGACCHYTDKELLPHVVSILMQIIHDPPKEEVKKEKVAAKKKKKK